MHASVLAEVLAFSGELDTAWDVLGSALRLGPAGPAETTFYRRGLAVGAMLQTAAGHVDLARALLRELEQTPRVYRPLVRSLRAVGVAALAVATGDRSGAGELAWQAGRSYADAGLLQPALLTWMFAPPPLTPERAAAVRRARSRAVLPLLDPYLDLQLALADGDRDAVAAALPRAHPRVARVLTAAAHELLGLDAGPGAVPGAHEPGRPERLSGREAEIAALGRDGLSNRQIAERLHLSVRTVENHMSHALRKLGYRARGDLARWSA
ncbi:helix-turn-helix transcriptional regulator [Cellulomonas sp. Marseille-Q8402]